MSLGELVVDDDGTWKIFIIGHILSSHLILCFCHHWIWISCQLQAACITPLQTIVQQNNLAENLLHKDVAKTEDSFVLYG